MDVTDSTTVGQLFQMVTDKLGLSATTGYSLWAGPKQLEDPNDLLVKYGVDKDAQVTMSSKLLGGGYVRKSRADEGCGICSCDCENLENGETVTFPIIFSHYSDGVNACNAIKCCRSAGWPDCSGLVLSYREADGAECP